MPDRSWIWIDWCDKKLKKRLLYRPEEDIAAKGRQKDGRKNAMEGR